MKYAKMATDKGTAAENAAMMELIIDGTDKNVGGSSLKADGPSSVVTTDGITVETGLLPKGDQPMHTALSSTGVVGEPGNPVLTPNPYKAPVAVALGGMFPIGKLVDSADDLARLMIVTQYGGSKTVKVYAEGTAVTQSGTRAGFLTIVITDAVSAETNNVALRREGTYYPAGDNDALDQVDEVAFKATGKEVFSYVDPNIEAGQGAGEDVRGVEKRSEGGYDHYLQLCGCRYPCHA